MIKKFAFLLIALTLLSCQAVTAPLQSLRATPTASPRPALPIPTPTVQQPGPQTAAPTLASSPIPQLSPSPLFPTQPVPTLQPSPSLEGGVSGQASIGDPYTPELGNTGYDVQQYTLRMALDPASTEIKANVTITAAATLDQLETFSLDFSGYQIQELRVNGELAEYRREPNKLWVLLPALQSKGENFTVDIAYSGTGQNTPSRYLPVLDHVGMFFEPPDLIYVASEPDGAHDWFPCNDHPRDKAAFRFEIYVPQGMQVAANGTLLETNTGADDPFPGGGLTDEYVWEETSPMATYLATVAVSHYTRLDGSSPNGIPLRSYVFPSSENEFKQTSAPVGEALDWMSTMFGGYPFDKFGYVLVTNLGASLEDQTMVILDEAMLDENTMIHEMAHMWFGDWVSLNTWGEMWRNEGFATYISMMWQFRNNPQGLNQTIQRYEGQIQLNPSGYALDNLPPADLFGFDSYVKGAVVVHNLRQTVGDQAFFVGLKDYLAKYGGGTATDAQFQAVMEQASGMNLDAFFTKWVQSK